jgi:hypothetical protein
MKKTRLWRTATAGLATATLLTMTAGAAVAQSPEDLPLPGDDEGTEEVEPEGDDEQDELEVGGIPETGMGGFSGYADAQGATVFVGLPQELADGLEPVLDGLGVAGSIDANGTTLSGIRIDLAAVQANLERAAAGEDISSEATALLTNLILGSGAADQPGACQGAPAEVALPPDEETPLITLTILGVDCEETEERAFANAQIAGLDIRLGALIELGLPEELRAGVQQLVDELNTQLLAPLSEGVCDNLLGPIADGLIGAEPCEEDDPLLQLTNPFDIDVPLVDLDLVAATAEVTQDGGSVTATATSTFGGLNVLGVSCIGQDGNEPLTFTSTATSDGATATRAADAPSLALRLCQQEQSLLRILLGDGPLGDIAVFEEIVQEELFDGQLQELFDGVDELLATLSTEAITQAEAVLGDIEGAGTTARTEPFVIASTVPLSGLPGFGDTPLADIAVVVVGGATEVGVNALPAGEEPEAQPVTPAGPEAPAPPASLPRTGAGAGALFGLMALGAATALRRRDS